MQTMSSYQSVRSILSIVLTVFLFASCGGDKSPAKKATVPVKGQFFYRLQPAAGAQVFFQPQDGGKAEDWTSGFPRATVAADGSFAVGTYEDADGAPPGEYVVTCTWPAVVAGAEENEEPPPDRFGGRFHDPSRSPLRAKVGETATDLPRFDLK